ncbi:hypothetical protein BH23ACT7_BH23ACT7_05530 [soil metagenome]
METSTTLTRTVHGREVPATGAWPIDPSHSSVEAVARHLMVAKVRGSFERFSGTFTVAERPEDSSVTVEIDAASINTRDENRDTHLRSGDFLDVERFPTLDFVSTAVEPRGKRWAVHGDLTIRGVTRPVTLDVEYLGTLTDPWGNSKAAFSATAEIDREDYGITWNQALEAGGVLVGRTLKVKLDIQAVLQQ